MRGSVPPACPAGGASSSTCRWAGPLCCPWTGWPTAPSCCSPAGHLDSWQHQHTPYTCVHIHVCTPTHHIHMCTHTRTHTHIHTHMNTYMLACTYFLSFSFFLILDGALCRAFKVQQEFVSPLQVTHLPRVWDVLLPLA